MQRGRRVAVVGAGISGLTTTAMLMAAGEGDPEVVPEVVLVESEERLGGKILTTALDGRAVEAGPDAFLVRSPAMRRLVEHLGLSDDLVAPAALGSYVWSRGSLRRLPPGTVFGVPERLLPLLRSGLLSPRGVLRAGLDLVLPRHHLGADPSVDDLVRPRFGAQVADRLVDPLVGGVHAGSTKQLSAASALPEVEAVARKNRSLYLGLRRRETAAPSGPPLMSVTGGLGRVVDALTQRISAATVMTGRTVTSLERVEDGYRLTVGGTEHVDVDAVVLATPAYVTAGLLADLAPGAAAALREVPYVDVATVALAYPHHAVRRPLDATGFLVPPVEGRLLVGCTWLSTKWKDLEGGPSYLIRAMVGRAGDSRWMALSDEELVAQVHHELVAAMGMSAPPTAAHVQRWPRALPQYVVGHRARVARAEAALSELPGLHLTGAAYRGAGIAACVADAELTAATVLAQLTSPLSVQEVVR